MDADTHSILIATASLITLARFEPYRAAQCLALIGEIVERELGLPFRSVPRPPPSDQSL